MFRPRDFIVRAGDTVGPGCMTRCLVDASTANLAFVDLRGARWFEPFGLVSIATFIESQLGLGRRTRLLAPQQTEVANYASRMLLGRVVEELGGTHDLPNVLHHHVGTSLLELQRFHTEDASGALAGLVHDRLAATDPHLARAMHQSLGEIGQNVHQHAQVGGGFIAAQVTRKGNGREVAFAIGDAGIGLLKSLESRGFADDPSVLAAVMGGGVSRTDDPGRGNGFRTARDLLTAQGGVFFVQSGWASRVERAGGFSGPVTHPDTYVRGTVVQGRIDC